MAMSTQAQPGYFMASLSLDLPDDILKLIGRINVAYGQLEHILAVTLKRTSAGKITLAQAEALIVSLSSLPALKDKTVEQFGVWALDQAKEAQLDDLLREADPVAK